MMIDVLVAEIGSTTTVVNAFSGFTDEKPLAFLGQGQARTSVDEGDVLIGLREAIAALVEELGIEDVEYRELYATSSAAGGLKMTVHGLVFDMTARAAKEAALGAGAVIKFVTAGRLRRSDLKKIQDIHPNLILLAGGVDYGERETALDNAEAIRGLELEIPIIYAGNVENQEEIQLIFEDSKQQLYLVENVYPKIDDLNIEPTRKVIHQAFEEHIVHAPGMDKIYDMVNGKITPTPGAVMLMAQVFYKALGDVLVIDVGGATTDIHSVTQGSAAYAKMAIAPEPVAKRTVEGDIGLYLNLKHLLEREGIEELEAEGHDVEAFLAHYTGIPQSESEKEILTRLTRQAVNLAVDRHVGQIRYVYGPSGRETLIEGKDLTKVKYIIGTGGALSRLKDGAQLLTGIKKEKNSPKLLPKGDVHVFIDHDYIMASLGVLSLTYPAEALQLLAKSLTLDLPERGE